VPSNVCLYIKNATDAKIIERAKARAGELRLSLSAFVVSILDEHQLRHPASYALAKAKIKEHTRANKRCS
jgi:hypothetical protein